MSDISQENAVGTRERLLEAAGEVFAEHGFRAATIRDICSRAGANVAAVNYHFRDKEGLYSAVLQYAYDRALQKHPPSLGVTPDTPPEERLKVFIRSFMMRIFDEGKPAWHGRLMIKEISEPTGALDLLIEQSVRAQFELLISILQALAGDRLPQARLRMCATSIVAQCIHAYYARHVIQKLNPQLIYGPDNIDILVNHIFGFSLAAIRGLAGRENAP